MRVQLTGQTLRLRVDEPELQRLLQGEGVDNTTRWPDGETGQQRLTLGDDAAWQRTAEGWTVTLPTAEVRALAERLPSREGLTFALAVPQHDDPLQLCFDVDVRDSTRRRYGRD